MKSAFRQVLSKTAADAGPDNWPFHKGDAAHLARWLDDERAEEIWQNLYPGALDEIQAYCFIVVMLCFRQLAEQLDRANQRVSAAKRAKKCHSRTCQDS